MTKFIVVLSDVSQSCATNDLKTLVIMLRLSDFCAYVLTVHASIVARRIVIFDIQGGPKSKPLSRIIMKSFKNRH